MINLKLILAAAFAVILILNPVIASAGPSPVALTKIIGNTASHLNLAPAAVEDAILAELKRSGSGAKSIAELSSLSETELMLQLSKLAKLPNPSAIVVSLESEAKSVFAERLKLGNADGSATTSALKAPEEVALVQEKAALIDAMKNSPMNAEAEALAVTKELAIDSVTTMRLGNPTITAATCNQNKLSLNSFLNLHKINHYVAVGMKRAENWMLTNAKSANKKAIADCARLIGGAGYWLGLREVLFKNSNPTILEVSTVGGKISSNCKFDPYGGLTAGAAQVGSTWSQLEERYSSGACPLL